LPLPENLHVLTCNPCFERVSLRCISPPHRHHLPHAIIHLLVPEQGPAPAPLLQLQEVVSIHASMASVPSASMPSHLNRATCFSSQTMVRQGPSALSCLGRVQQTHASFVWRRRHLRGSRRRNLREGPSLSTKVQFLR
jgi:hypothetical protein